MRTPVAFKRFELYSALQTIVKKKMCIKENTSFLFHNYVQNCQRYSFMYARAFKNYYIKMIWWLSSNASYNRSKYHFTFKMAILVWWVITKWCMITTDPISMQDDQSKIKTAVPRILDVL